MSQSAHRGLLEWLSDWISSKRATQPPSTGWERTHITDSMPRLPAPRIEYGNARYPLHQNERLPGELWRAWRMTHPYQPRQSTDAITPIPRSAPDTGGIRQLPARISNPPHDERALSELETSREGLPGLPKWLVADVPNGAQLPVQRDHASAPAQSQIPLPPFIDDRPQHSGRMVFVPGGDLLATMRPGSISRPLLPLPDGFSRDPDVVPDLPTEPRRPGEFAENVWLGGVQPPQLDPLSSQELAVVDRTAATHTSAIEQLETLANQPDDDETAEVPAYMRQRMARMQRESE